MNGIIDIIKNTNTSASNLNPTVIYNEGWMTRLFVYYSIKEKLTVNNIDFSKLSNWCSEAVITGPFKPRRKGDNLGEGLTHADMTLGDFNVNFEENGEVNLQEDAEIFGIIEAKMGSNLTKGIKNAPNYNQASRNLACIANETLDTASCKIFFGVVAPEKKIIDHKLEYQVNKEFMLSQIRERFEMYPIEFRTEKRMDSIISKAKEADVWVISYEEWLTRFSNIEIINELSDFYKQAKKWNNIK